MPDRALGPAPVVGVLTYEPRRKPSTRGVVSYVTSFRAPCGVRSGFGKSTGGLATCRRSAESDSRSSRRIVSRGARSPNSAQTVRAAPGMKGAASTASRATVRARVASTVSSSASRPAFASFHGAVSSMYRLARTASSDRKSTRLNSSHLVISYAVFCLKKKKSHSHYGRGPEDSAPPERVPAPDPTVGEFVRGCKRSYASSSRPLLLGCACSESPALHWR